MTRSVILSVCLVLLIAVISMVTSPAVAQLTPTPAGAATVQPAFFPSITQRAACQAASNQPWTLYQPKWLARRGVTLGGWIEQGVTLNGHDPGDDFNGPNATNDWADNYQLNQFWLYFHKQADGSCGLGWGGHVDVIFGSDSRFGTNYGLETKINAPGNHYGLALPQFYAEVAFGKLSAKFGHFAGILDYEVVPAPQNPFYSHSYGYSYTVPQLVTGVMTEYKATETITLQAGFTRGWMMFEDINDKLDFMGGVKWALPNDFLSVAWAMSIGPQDPAGLHDTWANSFVVQAQMTGCLRTVTVFNPGITYGGASRGTADAKWYGLTQYFMYKLTEQVDLNLRAEWLGDKDGSRVVGLGTALPGYYGWQGAGFAGDFYEITIGMKLKPRPNHVIRPELRWDWYDGGAGMGGRLPYNDGSRDSQFTAAVDWIMTF